MTEESDLGLSRSQGHIRWRKKNLANIDLQISQQASSQLFGYSARTGRAWCRGEVQVDQCVEIVARLMVKYGLENPWDLLTKVPAPSKGK
jgi:hypothetical protein